MSAAEEHSDNGKAGDNKKEDADSGTNIPATARRNTTGLNWADATEQGVYIPEICLGCLGKGLVNTEYFVLQLSRGR